MGLLTKLSYEFFYISNECSICCHFVPFAVVTIKWRVKLKTNYEVPKPSKHLFLLGLLTTILYEFLTSPVHAPCPTFLSSLLWSLYSWQVQIIKFLIIWNLDTIYGFLTERTWHRDDFNELDVFTSLHFTATRALPAAKQMQIFPTTQHADNIWNEGKFLRLFTDHRRCWKHYPSTCKYLSQLIVSLKNTHTTILFALTSHQAPMLT
jgi:hypothetical protein